MRLRGPFKTTGLLSGLLSGLLLSLVAAYAVTSHAQAQQPAAADAEQTRSEIEELKRQIERIGLQQRRREGQRSALQTQLRENELQLAATGKDLQGVRGELTQNEAGIQRLSAEREVLNSQAAEQQDAVAAELRRAWQSSRDGQLKLILNQEDPDSVARLLAYYRLIVDARSELLTRYSETLASIATLETSLKEARILLEEQRAAVAEKQAALQEIRQQRQKLLVAIEAELASGGAQLTARQEDQESLEALLVDIEAALSRIGTQEEVEPFSSTRGLMPWPVEGRITNRFGNPRNRGKMRWRGVRLRAEAGSSVAAIHHGRIVYADWLRGSGLLMVIDHGEGYMSLYAHNESLLREVGDWVSSGEAISTVGSSGGQTEAALYFEIRKDGKPTDPQKWCRG